MNRWWPVVAIGGAGLAAALVWLPLRRRLRRRASRRARQQFHLAREWLEAKFFDLAVASGKPRGLHWVDCCWQDAVSFARDRRSGNLAAFVGLSVRFEAEEGGPMEDNPNVAAERLATAVFHYQGGHWSTTGRAIFNLRPQEALARYMEQFEEIGGSKG